MQSSNQDIELNVAWKFFLLAKLNQLISEKIDVSYIMSVDENVILTIDSDAPFQEASNAKVILDLYGLTTNISEESNLIKIIIKNDINDILEALNKTVSPEGNNPLQLVK